MSRLVPPLLLASLVAACSARGAYYAPSGAYSDYAAVEQLEVVAQVASTSSARSQAARARAAAGEAPPPMPAPAEPMPAQAIASADDGLAVASPEEPDVAAERLLVYTAQVTLAIFDVAASQDAALRIVEELGGYASQRASNYVVFRVPAAAFRTALDALDDLGDVLSLDWQAADVSDQYRDIDIRLQNALQMRDRLQTLLERAATVEEMLAIEQQIERLTLEIELYRGQLRALSDQIAYSTITLSFARVTVSDVPTNEYRLPFPWLDTLGLEQLLAM